jgi:hypothetical protein
MPICYADTNTRTLNEDKKALSDASNGIGLT